ncbi:MAG: pyruvate ferredoxin oxidoreductase [Actinomycetota bacterium]
MNCLSTSCLIMTENGLKKITEVKEGDKIYAFDQKTHQLVLRRCTGVFDNGIREVYGVETLHHSIKATANHPFLVLKRNGRGRRDSFVWKTLAEIKVGDEVVVLKNLENKYFDTEKIKNIRLAGCEPTLDLRVEDEHNFIADGIVVHNTGIQRSSATPLGAWTTTSPVGKVIPGKTQNRKDLTACVAAHNIPYVAQASPSHWRDLVTKAEKAFNAEGPAFLNILAPCPRGWRYPTNQTIRMARLAVETCFWPLYEVENGNWRLTHKPKEKKPLVEWLKPQGRFKHLFKPENRHVMEEFQAKVDEDWNNLLKRCQIE